MKSSLSCKTDNSLLNVVEIFFMSKNATLGFYLFAGVDMFFCAWGWFSNGSYLLGWMAAFGSACFFVAAYACWNSNKRAVR